jgi:ankyrin repeat protein
MKIKRMLSFNSLRRKSTLDDMSSARNSESSTSNESRYSLTTLVKENRMPDLEVYLSKNDINGVSDAGIAPLHAACLYGNLDIAVWLLDKGASHKVLNSKGFTPFLLSCARGHVDIAKMFLERFDDCINDQDKNGRTALHLAGYFGQYEVLDYIMNLGEGPTYRTLDKFGDSVLHTACLQGNPDHIKYIAEADMSKLNAKNNKEETPLHILVDKNHSLAAVMLMGLGAEPNLQDKLGNGALHLAARKCSPDMTENDDVILLKVRVQVLIYVS